MFVVTLPTKNILAPIMRKGTWTVALSNLSFLLLITLVCYTSSICVAYDAVLPRYDLKPGMEIHYTTKVLTEHDDPVLSSTGDWKVWVTRSNDDGSHRVVIHYSPGEDSGYDPELACLDLFPNGRVSQLDNGVHRFELEELFPRLPTDLNEMGNGWQSPPAASISRFRYTSKVASKPSDTWQFVQVEDGPAVLLKPSLREAGCVFDLKKGLIQRINVRSKVAPDSSILFSERIELKAVTVREPAWIAALDNDMQEYLEAKYQYDELINSLDTSIGEADRCLDEIHDLWMGLGREVTSDIVRDAAKLQLAHDESLRINRLEEARIRATIIGHHAAEWERRDLDDAVHKLKDYAGKVVVLHFWHADSDLSIRAAPQMNHIVDEFAEKPVAVLGMNFNDDTVQALFVEEAMGFKYPSLHANEELARKYGVSTFPTTVVVDQEGIVRAFHVDYARSLGEDVAATIQKLLAETTNSRVRR
jgi:peroxiredoxin